MIYSVELVVKSKLEIVANSTGLKEVVCVVKLYFNVYRNVEDVNLSIVTTYLVTGSPQVYIQINASPSPYAPSVPVWLLPYLLPLAHPTCSMYG